jgi:hypothetical protein
MAVASSLAAHSANACESSVTSGTKRLLPFSCSRIRCWPAGISARRAVFGPAVHAVQFNG